MADELPEWVTRVRNDPLGARGYNQVAVERLAWARRLYGYEHIQYDGGIAARGEHNAREVPREVGSLEAVAGPAYTATNFRYATGTTRPGLGTCSLTLDPAPYVDINRMAVQVQNMSNVGDDVPCMTGYAIASTSEIQFFNKKLNNALGAGNAWVAEDACFAVAIHADPVPDFSGFPSSLSKQRGDPITSSGLDFNNAINVDALLRASYLAEHNVDGVHINREVARSWAHIGIQSGAADYDVLDTMPLYARCKSATRNSIGKCTLVFAAAPTNWVLDAQPFVQTDYARLNAGAEGDTFVSVCPREAVTLSGGELSVIVYLYQYNFGTQQWARADTDFFISVHGGS